MPTLRQDSGYRDPPGQADTHIYYLNSNHALFSRSPPQFFTAGAAAAAAQQLRVSCRTNGLRIRPVSFAVYQRQVAIPPRDTIPFAQLGRMASCA